MDKLMVQAVAGAGKTTFLLNQLNLENNVALITYTKNNQEQLKENIIKKFGYYPNNIHVFVLFEFIYKFCYRPLQNKYPITGICFDHPSPYLKGFHHKDGRIYSNQISRLLLAEKINYLTRIERFFDYFYIDEVQDIAADDFDWLMSLKDLKIPVTLVGDFYQSTFVSSRRGNKGKAIYSSIENYKNQFDQNGFHFEESKLIASHRCSKSVSHFIQENLNIRMESHRDDVTNIELLTDIERIEGVLQNDSIIKLFHQNSKKYSIKSDNWGNVKGLGFQDVCVILNPTTYKKFPDKLYELAPTTLSKFYVACTRTKGRLFFIEEKKIPSNFKNIS